MTHDTESYDDVGQLGDGSAAVEFDARAPGSCQPP